MPTILIEKNIMVPMRDGVRLAADVYRLEGAAPAPVLVTRTPYDKENTAAGSAASFDILRAVQAGYVVVIQDVRGRFASEGSFAPMIQETNDGLDTFAWAAAQPWSKTFSDTSEGMASQRGAKTLHDLSRGVNAIIPGEIRPSRLILPIIER